MVGPGFYNNTFLKIKSDKNLISESISRILMTTPGERVGRPNFGSGLRKLLFETTNDIYLQDLKRMIESAINLYEPRVNVRDVVVNADGNIIFMKILFNEVGNPLNEDLIEFEINLEEGQ